jgi:hypothetical protein
MVQLPEESFWPTILDDFRRSGLTQAQFCELRQLRIHSFRYWLYRLQPGPPPRRSSRRTISPTRSSTPNKAPAFLPVQVCPQPLVPTVEHVDQSPTPLEVVLSDRCHVRVSTGFDPATLHRLLDVLEDRS